MMNRTKLDDLQLALDVVGLEPTIGTAADGTNVVISLLRAASEKEKDLKKKHLIDVGISAVSTIPFADIVKLLKLRKLRKVAAKGGRAIKTDANETPKSYSLDEIIGGLEEELTKLDENWMKNFGKWAKKTFGFGPKKRNPAVWRPKKTLTALHKDPYNPVLWIEKLRKKKFTNPATWTPKEEKLLQQFEAELKSYFTEMWKKIPPPIQKKIANKTNSLSGLKKVAKQLEYMKAYTIPKPTVVDEPWKAIQKKWSTIGPGNTPVNELDTAFLRCKGADPSDTQRTINLPDDESEPSAPQSFCDDPSSELSREHQLQIQRSKERKKYLRRLPEWAHYHYKYTIPRSLRREIDKQTVGMKPLAALAKRIQMVKQYVDSHDFQPHQQMDLPWSQKFWKESITKNELMKMVGELVQEEMANEGYGWVYPKDIAKDPKHTTNKTTGKNQRWTINYQSASDLKKHGKTAKSPVNEAELPVQTMSDFNGKATEINPHSMKDKCPRCKGQLKYITDISTPDHGQRWECQCCDKGFVKMGKILIDPSDVVENNITKKELVSIIKEVVDEVWSSWQELKEFDNDNEMTTDGQPIPKDASKIAQLIFSLKDGEYIWFSFDKQGCSGHGYGVEKKVEGDECVYRTTGKYGEYLEQDEDVEKYAQRVLQDKYAHYYFIGPIEGYQKPRRRHGQDDDQ